MPLTEGATHKGPVVERYFENLLPDSGEIRRRIGQHVGAHSDRALDLLEKIGRDCVGVLQLTVEREGGSLQLERHPAAPLRTNGTAVSAARLAA